jgi:hypothetical protein
MARAACLLRALASAAALAAVAAQTPSPMASASPAPLSPLPPLPALPIDASAISISGISSGADLAVQFSIAYADIIMGVGVFAGQAWRCAVTRFDADALFTCAEQPAGRLGPGCAG